MSTAGRVLIVDDYQENVTALRLLLERRGYDVLTASNGRDALHWCTVNVPTWSCSMSSCRKSPASMSVPLSRTSPKPRLTPVVLVSAVQERALRLEGLDAGADDFLSKPIDVDELYARVRSLIRIKRLTDDLESAEALFLTLGADHRSARPLHREPLRPARAVRDRARLGLELERRRSRCALSRRLPPRHRQDRDSRSGAAQKRKLTPDESTS